MHIPIQHADDRSEIWKGRAIASRALYWPTAPRAGADRSKGGSKGEGARGIKPPTSTISMDTPLSPSSFLGRNYKEEG